MATRRQLDLNLFRVLDSVMQQESVAGAARRLNVTPSAISHSLARLRKAFDDPLFVHSETGMQPTERARVVYPLISSALEQLDSTIVRKPFDPTRSQRVFTVSASPYSAVILLPSLLRHLAVLAPGIGLVVASREAARVPYDLREGRVTMAIGQFSRLDPEIRRKTLFSDDEVIICGSDHPLSQRSVTWEEALRFPSVKIQLDEVKVAPDAQRERRPAALVTPGSAARRAVSPARPRIVVSDPSPILQILEETNLIAIGPRRLALRTKGRLAVVEPTDRRVSFETVIAWHPSVERDPGAAWLIDQFVEGSRALATRQRKSAEA
jgi:DNA-binding transcriptional LysR family regulator